MTLPAPRPLPIRLLLACQKQGLTLREIGEKFGLHRLSVHDRLSEYWKAKRTQQ